MAHSHLTAEQVEHFKDLKGNFTLSPNYIDLVKGIWTTISWYYAPQMWRGYTFPRSFIDEFTRHFYFPINQIYYILYIAIFITILRYLFERFVCKVCYNKEQEFQLNNLYL
jgi:hypothetical protein